MTPRSLLFRLSLSRRSERDKPLHDAFEDVDKRLKDFIASNKSSLVSDKKGPHDLNASIEKIQKRIIASYHTRIGSSFTISDHNKLTKAGHPFMDAIDKEIATFKLEVAEVRKALKSAKDEEANAKKEQKAKFDEAFLLEKAANKQDQDGVNMKAEIATRKKKLKARLFDDKKSLENKKKNSRTSIGKEEKKIRNLRQILSQKEQAAKITAGRAAKVEDMKIGLRVVLNAAAGFGGEDIHPPREGAGTVVGWTDMDSKAKGEGVASSASKGWGGLARVKWDGRDYSSEYRVGFANEHWLALAGPEVPGIADQISQLKNQMEQAVARIDFTKKNIEEIEEGVKEIKMEILLAEKEEKELRNDVAKKKEANESESKKRERRKNQLQKLVKEAEKKVVESKKALEEIEGDLKKKVSFHSSKRTFVKDAHGFKNALEEIGYDDGYETYFHFKKADNTLDQHFPCTVLNGRRSEETLPSSAELRGDPQKAAKELENMILFSSKIKKDGMIEAKNLTVPFPFNVGRAEFAASSSSKDTKDTAQRKKRRSSISKAQADSAEVRKCETERCWALYPCVFRC